MPFHPEAKTFVAGTEDQALQPTSPELSEHAFSFSSSDVYVVRLGKLISRLYPYALHMNRPDRRTQATCTVTMGIATWKKNDAVISQSQASLDHMMPAVFQLR